MGRRRSSAAYRIALTNWLAFAAGLALLGVVVFGAMHIAFMHQLDSMISDEAQTLVDEYELGGSRELAEAIAEREMVKSPTRMMYALFAPDGRRIAGSLNSVRPPLGIHDVKFNDPKEGPDDARGVGIDISPRERLLVAADREWIERIDETLIGVFAVAFLAACAAALGGALVLGGYLQRRLRAISQGAEAIIAGDISARMPLSSSDDEFDQVAATLNRMLDRIQNLLENLRQVSSDIAHDLRTPLARLRNSLERGLTDKEHGDRAAQVVEDALKRVDEVLSLFAAILRIAEVESGETKRLFKKVDVSELASDLAESYGPALEDAGRSFISAIEPGLATLGDAELLAQAAINLIENAQQHTPAGTVIRLTAVSDRDRVCIQVADTGPGIPTGDFGRVVKRFARLDRSRSTSGYGLGLSLVEAIAKIHGGRLILKDLEPGLAATIELPVETAEALP